MFGVARKKSTKPTRTVRSSAASSSDDDEDDDGALHRVQQHSRKKKNKASKKNKKAMKSTMLSFDPEEGGDDDDDDNDIIIPSQKKSKKRKKKHHKKNNNSSGLGYGGVMMSMNASDDESSSDRESKMDVDDRDTTGGGYDIAALAKLKSEQKRSTFAKDEKSNVHQSKSGVVEGASSSDKDINMMGENDNDKKESIEEEEFIPLSGDKSTGHRNKNNIDPVVLTGDEALAFAQEDENDNNIEFDHGLQSPPSPPTLDGGVTNNDKSMKKMKKGDINADIMMDVDEPSSNEVDEGNRQWEDITARRAGVLPPKSGVSSNRPTRQQDQINNSSSLGEIRTSLQPTITNLENVYSDLESSISRHESTLSSTRDELSNKERTLEKHGKALEYYQGLREDLATWMGALRELNDMVTKVEDAQRKLEAEMTWIRLERFVEWGNDCTEVLESNSLLKNKIMGKDSSLDSSGSILKAVRQVDEFGRDMSSMASMSRVKRWNQRRKRCINRLHGDDESAIEQSTACSTNEDNIDTSEIDEWKRRREALVQAMAIIPNLMKDEYLSISNLCTLFLEWERTYPEDYVSCYADMSLVQMTSVLVRLDLCGQWDVLGLYAQSTAAHYEVTESKWFRDLKKIDSQRMHGVDPKMEKEGKTNPRKDVLIEVVQKQIVSRILDLFSFENEGNETTCLYDPFSVDQTKCLCSMMGSLLEYFSSSYAENSREICKKTVQKVLNALLSLVKYHIERVVVPIADESKIMMTRNEFVARDRSNEIDSEASDSIVYATTIQARALCQLVKNILGHWYPILNKELDNQNENLVSLVQCVFMDIISLRILPVLHSLHDITSSGNDNNKKYIGLPKTLITEILDVAQMAESGKEDASWVMMTAPLRVAVNQWDSR